MRDNYSIRVFNHLAIETTKALSIRVFYCLKGNCKMTINLQEFDLSKDEIAFVILNDIYSIESSKDSICCVIDIPIHLYMRITGHHILSSGSKIDKDEKGRTKYWILKLLEMHCIQKTDEVETNKLIQYILVELSTCKVEYLKFNKRMYFSEEVHEYLVNHHDNKINKQDLVNAVNISNQTLTHMFKETPFQTFNQYLNHIRLKFCLIDILTTHRPIEDIAIEHGFHHYSRFIQLFKDTYGQTPKLIRKDYRTTSIFQNESEEIDLNRHILKLVSSIQETTQHKIEERQIKMKESHVRYHPSDIYIEQNKSNYFDQLSFLNMKRALNINKRTIHYIVELDYLNISKEKEVFIKELYKLLHFIADSNMSPIFKITTQRSDVFTSNEKMSFNHALDVLFLVLRQFNHLHLGFLIERVTSHFVEQLKQMINRYFEEYQLIYRFKKGQYEEVDLTQIESKVDKIMIPVMQLERVNISLSKLIVEVDCLVNSKETILNQTILNHFKLLMTHYDKLGGLVLPQSEQYEITKIVKQELNSFQLLTYVLSMLNQLRGNIVYRSNEMIMTRYKHEYQVVTYFLNSKVKMNVHQYRLIFSDIKQLSHADTEYIDIQQYAMNENKSLDNLMLYHNQHWLAKLNHKDVINSSIDIPKVSIAHIKFLSSL
ncbi:AraC family transcriptional regulator [Staphylococcus caprae]|nr:AraC family transcriptional regulator [Staphylococcus caprae]